MADLVESVRKYINEVVHHTEVAVEKGVAAAKAEFDQEKVKLAAEVRAAKQALETAVKADAPVVAEELKKLAQDAVAALEAALKARGL